MTLQELLDEGKIYPFLATKDEIEKCLEISHRDIELAEKVFEEDCDWCLSISYNAILQACRAYMFFFGYRPSSLESHKTVFEFMQFHVNNKYSHVISYFDRIRKKRHRTTYDEVGLVSKTEAKSLMRIAKNFIADIENIIRSKE